MNVSNASRSLLAKVPGANRAIDFMCARINNVFSAEHNPETGAHTAITVDTINIDGIALFDTQQSNAGDIGKSLTITVDNVAALKLFREFNLSNRYLTVGSIPSTPNGTGSRGVGNGFFAGRNTSGNGAPGWIKFFSKTGTEQYFWITDAGELRQGDTPPTEDGGVPETYGTSVGGGAWTTFTPTRTSDTGAWTAGTITTAAYLVIGKTMHVSFAFTGTSNSVAGATLRIAIPGGFVAAKEMWSVISVVDNGAPAVKGEAHVTAAGTLILLTIAEAGAFAVSVTATNVRGTIAFEIQ